jgi:hypothetical protein
MLRQLLHNAELSLLTLHISGMPRFPSNANATILARKGSKRKCQLMKRRLQREDQCQVQVDAIPKLLHHLHTSVSDL